MVPVRPAELLTPRQVEDVHRASLEVLEQVGLLVRNLKARERFRRFGCLVDEDRQIVRMPARVVEDLRAAIPARFTFHARDPAFSRTVPDDALVVATASSAPDIVDPDSGAVRRARSDDIARIGHLVDGLGGIDVFSISVLADDAPPGQFSLSRFYPALKNCRKPARTSVIDRTEAEQVLKLGAEIAGGERAFLDRPFITFGYCSVVSPLTMDFDSTEMLMFYAERGLAAYGTIAPIGGISAPLQMARMLVQINAEWLATAVLAQMSHPGTALIYNHLPVVGDMRSGAYAPGAVETGVMAMTLAQMARFYRVPSGSYLGLTNAKIADCQAGYEKALSPALAAAAGIDFIVMGGLLDALMAFDFGQLAIDNEIALMLKRARQDLSLGDLAGAVAEIREAGPGGMYIGNAETLALMKSAALLPAVAERERREVWAQRGALDAHARALALAKAALCAPNAGALPPETDARVRAAFPGLVAGVSRPEPSWLAAAQPAQRDRRTRRRSAGG